MNLIKKLTGSIKAKLFFCFAIIAIVVTLAGLSSMVPFMRLERSMRRIGHDNLHSLLGIETIKDAQSQINMAERTLLIRQLADQDVRRKMYETIESSFERAKEAADSFASVEFSPTEQASWLSFRSTWATWRSKQQELLDILHKQEELINQGIRGGRQFDRIANQAFDLAFSELQEFRDQTRGHLDELADQIRDNAIAAVDETVQSAISYYRWLTAFLILAFVVSIFLGLWLSGRITRPILEGVKHITRIADGNLSHDVTPHLLAQSGETGLLLKTVQKLIESQRKEVQLFKSVASGDYTRTLELRSGQDELGHAMGQMIKTNNKALNQVNVAVKQVAIRSDAINNASQTLSQGALESASSLEEISASISQINEKTKINATVAADADQLAAASRAAVNQGYDAVAEMIAAMKDLQTTNAQIASVVKLIDDIAFQTNLLALNAAVEAARAGRHGRGFSIVADEVRNLAGRSAKAAQDTAQMLEKTIQKLEKGADLAESTDSAVREIVENTAKLADLFREIARSSNEQSLGIDQVAKGLAQIDRVTQHNTITAHESASAAIALSQQAEALGKMMRNFRLRKEAGDLRPDSENSRKRSGRSRQKQLSLDGLGKKRERRRDTEPRRQSTKRSSDTEIRLAQAFDALPGPYTPPTSSTKIIPRDETSPSSADKEDIRDENVSG